MKRFFNKNYLALFFFIILTGLYLCAFLADIIAPYHYDSDQRQYSYHPPTKIHFFDVQGNFHFRPFIYVSEKHYDEFRRRIYTEDTEKMYPVRFFILSEPYRMLGFIPLKTKLFGVENPARIYLLGADRVGRDLFSRILFGARISLMIGWAGVMITFVIGMLVGGISGYFGGFIDTILMRICEVLMMIPGFYLMLALRAAFPVSLSSVSVFFLIVIIMSFIGWASLARIIRGQILSLKQRDFVYASIAFGKTPFFIIRHHLLGHTLSYALVAMTMSVPGYILGESALSLLGLGIQEPIPSWGNLLSDAMDVSQIVFHPWILIPGLFIFLTIMSFNYLGDALRDFFDPKLVGRE